MRLEVDALGDAVLNVAMIFTAAIEQRTTLDGTSYRRVLSRAVAQRL